MIKLYLSSIIIWAIMVFGTAYIFEEKIMDNGWKDSLKTKKNPYVMLAISPAIPVVRAIFFTSAIAMALITKEKYDELERRVKNESN